MAGADGVDVVMLHQHQVLEHLLLAHGGAQHGVAVVAVDAPELDGHAVELHHGVLHTDVPEAHKLTDGFAVVAHDQCVEIGIFRVPQADVVQGDLKAVAIGAAVGDAIPAGVVEIIVGVVAGGGVLAPVLQLHIDAAVGAVRGHAGVDEVIPQAALLPAEDVDIPEDAAHAELVLILKVAAVAPLQHQHVDLVVAGMDEVGDVELADAVGDLAVAHEQAVHPEIEAGIHALKHQRPAALVLRQHEVAAIETAGVLFRHEGRIVGEGIAPVGVLVAIIALGLPD